MTTVVAEAVRNPLGPFEKEWAVASIKVEGATDQADETKNAWVSIRITREAMEVGLQSYATTFDSCLQTRPISPDPPNPPHLSHPATLMPEGETFDGREYRHAT